MKSGELTSAIVKSILKVAATGTLLSVAVLAPNAVQMLDKPLKKLLDGLDDKDREREIRRVASYMKTRGLLSGSYEHGLQITKRGRRRLTRFTIDEATIPAARRWDHLWRIVFYDIPEQRKSGRDALTRKLQQIGFRQLQRSVFIHPLPCREVIEQLAAAYSIDQYVTYIETPHIDNQQTLVKKFSKQLPETIFD